MRQQRQPNRWSCIATAFAMAMDIPVSDLIHQIGHDGSQIVAPLAEEPAGRRGFHSQECITVALSRGFAVTQIEVFPVSLFQGDRRHVITFPPATAAFDGNWERFLFHVHSSKGVLGGASRRTSHAVAVDHGHVFDPNGSSYLYSRSGCESRGFFAQTLWRVDRITK